MVLRLYVCDSYGFFYGCNFVIRKINYANRTVCMQRDVVYISIECCMELYQNIRRCIHFRASRQMPAKILRDQITGENSDLSRLIKEKEKNEIFDFSKFFLWHNLIISDLPPQTTKSDVKIIPIQKKLIDLLIN